MQRNRRLWIWPLLIGALWGSPALAGEFRFVATQIAPDRAIWQPSLVLIDNKTDLRDGLVFVVENGTEATHVFDVQGATELLGREPSGEERTAAPLSVTVGPHETKRLRVSTRPIGSGRGLRNLTRVTGSLHEIIVDLVVSVVDTAGGDTRLLVSDGSIDEDEHGDQREQHAETEPPERRELPGVIRQSGQRPNPPAGESEPRPDASDERALVPDSGHDRLIVTTCARTASLK